MRKAGNSHGIMGNVGKPWLFIREAFGVRDWEEPRTMIITITLPWLCLIKFLLRKEKLSFYS